MEIDTKRMTKAWDIMLFATDTVTLTVVGIFRHTWRMLVCMRVH